MAASPYLYPDQPETEREPIRPYASFATGANEMSTLDMAAGIQTIANEGVHMEPYYVEYIDDAFGNRVYTHQDPGTRVLDEGVANLTVDIMKGVLTSGTASRELADFASRRPAFGKTGTQMSNWTAFFVGATKELSTAVLVRDPDRYTEMRGIPEFDDIGISRVQGGTYPARIWGAYMENVGLEQFEFSDWDDPVYPSREPGRLYLPGSECVYEIVGYEPAPTVPPAAPADPAAPPPAVEGFRSPQAPPDSAPPAPPPATTTAPPTTPPTTTAPTPPPTSAAPTTTTTTTTLAPVPVFGEVTTGTTIPPDVLDPNAPLPLVSLDKIVVPCGSRPTAPPPPGP
jgi:penicillin-binding protein 1A